jgi:hypothetical protein
LTTASNILIAHDFEQSAADMMRINQPGVDRIDVTLPRQYGGRDAVRTTSSVPTLIRPSSSPLRPSATHQPTVSAYERPVG